VEGWNWETISYGHISIFNHCDIIGQQSNQTDGRTDRQTDRILIAKPRLHSMQQSKKLTEKTKQNDNLSAKMVLKSV